MAGRYSIMSLCTLAGVSRSGYYKWLNHSKGTTNRGKQNVLIKRYIKELHVKYRGTYGRKRMCIYLNKILDFPVNHKRVYRLMKELGLSSVIRKKVYKHKFKPAEVAENLLNRNFTAAIPLQKLCMDITYIPIDRRSRSFLYMNAVKDLYNGEIVAYDLSVHNDTRLVNNTLNKLFKMGISEECILHTDQGFQYTRKEYSAQLIYNKIVQSMSRRGNCWDNAPIENFFGHFKSELIYLVKTSDVLELTELIHQYINFYNNERIQLKTGMSPVEYRLHAC
jgi:putative transposase